MLLEANANPMACNKLGESCLYLAILRRHKQIQKLLEDHGARWVGQDSDLLALYNIHRMTRDAMATKSRPPKKRLETINSAI
jgi:ankyrin repeat protein